MKNIWYLLIGVYGLGVLSSFIILPKLFAPGPSLLMAILMSLFWPIFLILFIINAIF